VDGAAIAADAAPYRSAKEITRTVAVRVNFISSSTANGVTTRASPTFASKHPSDAIRKSVDREASSTPLMWLLATQRLSR
jgi:hypothetical protein